MPTVDERRLREASACRTRVALLSTWAGPATHARVGLATLLALAACGRTDMDLVPASEGGGSSSTGGSTGSSSGLGTGDTTESASTTAFTSTSTTTSDPSTTDDPSTTGITSTTSTSGTTDDPSTSSTTDDPSTSSTTDTDTDTGPPIECGNGILEPGEECDDGNADDDDACHDDCQQARATLLALGGNHTCVLVDNGSVRCWGNGNNGRTGHGDLQTYGDDEPASAAPVVSLGGPVQQLTAGLSHTCVRYGDGSVRCFGRGLEGQLGLASTQSIGDDELPFTAPLVPTGGAVQAVASRNGSLHGCALRADGQVRCWGAAGMGRLGVPGLPGNVGDDEPADAVGPVNVGGVVTALSTGAEHTCARLDDGSVRCWGSNGSGQLGRGVPGDVGDDEDPATVAPVSVGASVSSIATGWFHTCALLSGGGVRCWGRGNNGRLGYGNTTWVGLADTPADVGDVDVGGVVVQLVAGNAHTCALLVGGTVRCWGWGGQGQLGYGNTQDVGDDEPPSAAGDVPVGAAVVQIEAGANHTCALLESGQVRCWGNGGDGRLGYGDLLTIGDDETPAMAGDVPLFP